MSIISEVLQERIRQDLKWGQQNHGNMEYLSILIEEVGEVAKATLEAHFRHPGADPHAVRKELIQTIAVGIAFVECIDRRESREVQKVFSSFENRPSPEVPS